MVAILRLEPEFKKIFKAVRDELERLNTPDLKPLGLKRVAGRSFRKWADQKGAYEYLLENYADDPEVLFETPELKSIPKIEKEFKGIKKDPNFQKFIYKPVGKPTLVHKDDPRPDYEAETAEKVFKSYGE